MFIIRENDQGRFHVQNFGADVAGTSGEILFSLILENREGQEIGRVDNVSTKELGPSPQADDYRRNQYRITDYFIRNGTGEIVGQSQKAKLLLERMGVRQPNTIAVQPRTIIQSTRGHAKHPGWETPSREQVRLMLQTITPYVRFLDPSVIAMVVEQNKQISDYVAQLKGQNINLASHFWQDSAVTFPGVRRSVGGTDDLYKRQIVPVEERQKYQAVYIDDNSYPKHLWGFVLNGRRFGGKNPEGYELAHLFNHKLDANSNSSDELIGLEKYSTALSGFFTSAASCVFVPKGLARVTDLSLASRKLLHRKAVELYLGHCEVLPPGLELLIKDGDFEPAEFEWAEPVKAVDVGSLKKFFGFREAELNVMIAGRKAQSA